MLNIAIVTSEYDYWCFRMSCCKWILAEEGGYEKLNEVVVPEIHLVCTVCTVLLSIRSTVAASR